MTKFEPNKFDRLLRAGDLGIGALHIPQNVNIDKIIQDIVKAKPGEIKECALYQMRSQYLSFSSFNGQKVYDFKGSKIEVNYRTEKDAGFPFKTTTTVYVDGNVLSSENSILVDKAISHLQSRTNGLVQEEITLIESGNLSLLQQLPFDKAQIKQTNKGNILYLDNVELKSSNGDANLTVNLSIDLTGSLSGNFHISCGDFTRKCDLTTSEIEFILKQLYQTNQFNQLRDIPVVKNFMLDQFADHDLVLFAKLTDDQIQSDKICLKLIEDFKTYLDSPIKRLLAPYIWRKYKSSAPDDSISPESIRSLWDNDKLSKEEKIKILGAWKVTLEQNVKKSETYLRIANDLIAQRQIRGRLNDVHTLKAMGSGEDSIFDRLEAIRDLNSESTDSNSQSDFA